MNSNITIAFKQDAATSDAMRSAQSPEERPLKRPHSELDEDTALEAKHLKTKNFSLSDPQWTMKPEDALKTNPVLELRCANMIPYIAKIEPGVVLAVLLSNFDGCYEVLIHEKEKTLSFVLKRNTPSGIKLSHRPISFDVAAEAMLHTGIVSYYGAHLAPMWEDRELMDGVLKNLTDKEEEMLGLKRADVRLDEDIDNVLYWRALACEQVKEHLADHVPCDLDSYIDLKLEFKKLDEDLARLTEEKSEVNNKMQRLCVEAMGYKAVKDLKGERYANVLENILQFFKTLHSILLVNVPLSYIPIFLQHLEEEYILGSDFQEDLTYPCISLENWEDKGYLFQLVPSEKFDYDIEDYIF